jgi:uncharacterized protein (DUF1800 family)
MTDVTASIRTILDHRAPMPFVPSKHRATFVAPEPPDNAQLRACAEAYELARKDVEDIIEDHRKRKTTWGSQAASLRLALAEIKKRPNPYLAVDDAS